MNKVTGGSKLFNSYEYVRTRNFVLRTGEIMLRYCDRAWRDSTIVDTNDVMKTDMIRSSLEIGANSVGPSGDDTVYEYDPSTDSGMRRAISELIPDQTETNEIGKTSVAGTSHRRKLALILPAHDEELLIQSTILSAKQSGMDEGDIFVVDDASSDNTREKVLELLPESHLLSVAHSGKAGAVHKAIEHFKIEQQYEWVHVADADSLFAKDYFRIYRQGLSDQFVAAVGFVQSLKGNWLCSYRCFSYTYGQHLFRRLQSWLSMILVMPGPVTSYKTDIIKHLDFNTGSLTEDFDITVQIHRKGLGKIKFIPDAINYTQDPRVFRDFYRQTLRWYRGWFQGAVRYRLGLGMQLIDMGFLFQIFEMLFLGALLTFGVVVLVTNVTVGENASRMFLMDMGITVLFAVFCTMITGRFRIILILPLVFILRFVELLIYTQAFVEIVVFRRFENRTEVGWKVSGRRYALTAKVFEDG